MSAERKLYLRIFITLLIGSFMALVMIRVFAWSLDASGSNFLGRVLEAREALPAILQEEGDPVLVFGSSMVQAGFSARHFDRLMAEAGAGTKSWNFGFGGLNPYFQEILSRRIVEAFRAHDRKARLTLIEFNPFQTTTTRWAGAEPIVDSFMTMLASDRELFEIFLEDPERGMLLYNIKYLRDNVSAEMATTFFGQMFDEPNQESDRPYLSEEEEARYEEISADLNERFEQEYPDYVSQAWNYGWQGAGTVPWERPRETVDMFPEYYSYIQNERDLHDDLLNRISSADILELEFEDMLVDQFIQLVKNLDSVSEETEVILLPRNTAWVEYTPEVAARLQAVIKRIEKETGVPVRNHQDLDVMSPEMFSDTTHLGRYVGDIPYTEYLVEQYRERLATE